MHSFSATTPHPDGQKYLHVRIEEFSGFHDYDTGGASADPYVIFAATDGTRYSNLDKPPFPSPGGGQVRFKKREAHGGRLQPEPTRLTGLDAVRSPRAQVNYRALVSSRGSAQNRPGAGGEGGRG